MNLNDYRRRLDSPEAFADLLDRLEAECKAHGISTQDVLFVEVLAGSVPKKRMTYNEWVAMEDEKAWEESQRTGLPPAHVRPGLDAPVSDEPVNVFTGQEVKG